MHRVHVDISTAITDQLYLLPVISADLIREARLRADLSQAELARRLGRSQPQIARWESGVARTSLETVVEVVRACGLELTTRLHTYDDSRHILIRELLDLPPSRRLARQVAAANNVAKTTKKEPSLWQI